MRGLRLAVVVLPAAVLIGGCGGDGTRMVTPDNVSPTLGGLAITGPDSILTGTPTGYVASGTFTNGTTASLTPTWKTSNPAIATVDASGRVEGRSQGSFTLTASYLGHDVSKGVQVVNNYGGHWQGEYRVLSCQDDGDLADHDGGFCRTVSVPGNVYRITIDITQEAADLTSVTVRMSGETFAGNVDSDGGLTWSGMADVLDWDGDVTGSREIHWDSGLSADATMTGRFRENYRSIGFRNGSARMEYQLLGLKRMTTGARATR